VVLVAVAAISMVGELVSLVKAMMVVAVAATLLPVAVVAAKLAWVDSVRLVPVLVVVVPVTLGLTASCTLTVAAV
jgi:hypothetical protein